MTSTSVNRSAARACPLLLLSVVLVLTAACSPRDRAPAEPGGAPPAAAGSAPPAAAVVSERTAEVDVPAGWFPFVEYADAKRGYALFTDCGSAAPCAGLLFATADGGATWQPRRMPVKEDRNIQLYVDGPELVTIWAEDEGYHTSRDGGRSFSFGSEVPRDYRAASGLRYGVDYTAHEPVLLDWQTGRPVPLPAGYEGGGAVVTRDGAIWLTRFAPDKETARSVDGGRTWQRLTVPEQPGRKLFMLMPRISPTGDAWLVGEQDPMSPLGGGTSVLRGSVLKGTGLPLLWQLVDGAWRPRPIEGLKEQPNFSYSVAPAGDGLLAIAGPDGLGYLADRYVEVPGTPRLDWVGLLPDGTLFARQNAPGEVYLGTGHGWQRDWVKATLAGR